MPAPTIRSEGKLTRSQRQGRRGCTMLATNGAAAARRAHPRRAGTNLQYGARWMLNQPVRFHGRPGKQHRSLGRSCWRDPAGPRERAELMAPRLPRREPAASHPVARS
jgi:hypothetical protein